MSAPKVRADYDQLQAAAGRFGGQAQAARQSLQALQRELDLLQGGDWIGPGAAAFYQEMGSLVLPALNRLTTALEAAQQTTVQINRVMAQAEAEAARWLRGEGTGQAVALGGAAFSAAPGPAAGGVAAKPTGSVSRLTAEDVARGTQQFNAGIDRMVAQENAAVDRTLSQFSPRVRELAKRSQTLRAQLHQLEQEKYTIQTGPPGSGFFHDPKRDLINIEQPLDDEQTVALIAHEVGHGVDKLEWTTSKEKWTREEFVADTVAFDLRGEGRAQFNALQVRAELVAAGGPDIGILGHQDPAFEQAYNSFRAGHVTHAQTIERMATLMSTERPSLGRFATYRDMFHHENTLIWDTGVDLPVMHPKRPHTP